MEINHKYHKVFEAQMNHALYQVITFLSVGIASDEGFTHYIIPGIYSLNIYISYIYIFSFT